MSPILSILIVTYRTPELTAACLQSIREYPPSVAFEVLVLDNDPSDGTSEFISKHFPEVRLVPSVANLGFARGNNELARHAGGEFLLLLNSDTLVHAGSLQAIIDFARLNPRGGLSGGSTVRPSGELDPASCWGLQSIWSLCCFSLCLTHFFRHNRFLDPESLGSWKRDTVREVGVVSGCLALIRRDLWQALDGFDERFWMYGEDQDLAIRVRDRSLHPMITPNATITHVLGASSSSAAKTTLVLKARVTLMQKHWSPWRATIGGALLLTGCFLRHLLTPPASAWTKAWKSRADWSAGFPDRPKT